jgi:hypothetical protein
MKLGTENRATTIIALVLFVLAVFLLLRMRSGGGQPAAAAAPAATTAAPAAPQPARGRRGRRNPGARNQASANAPLDPRLRLDLLKQSEETEYKGAGRNIFIAQSEIPKPVENPIKKAANTPPPVPEPPPGPPPPPPINLKFFGFATSQGAAKKVFLGNGDDVFVAGEGDIVNRRYKVMKINPNSVEIEDVLSNNRQTIPLAG